MYGILLYCILLYCLYYTIIYYTILYYSILYCIIPYYTVLYYTILYFTILYYIILSGPAAACAEGAEGSRGRRLHSGESRGYAPAMNIRGVRGAAPPRSTTKMIASYRRIHRRSKYLGPLSMSATPFRSSAAGFKGD